MFGDKGLGVLDLEAVEVELIESKVCVVCDSGEEKTERVECVHLKRESGRCTGQPNIPSFEGKKGGTQTRLRPRLTGYCSFWGVCGVQTY